MILIAILLCSKFYNDIFYGNHFVAHIGGVSLEEINQLEKEFITLLNWRLWVDPAEYLIYENNI